MTNPITINGLTTTTTAAAGDFVAIWRASNGDTRKITKTNFMGATFTGGGSIATGGFTLTVPATGTAALLGAAQTFSANNRFNGFLTVNRAASDAQVDVTVGAAARYGLRVNTAASPSLPVLLLQNNGVNIANMFGNFTSGTFDAATVLRGLGLDNGTGIGNRLVLGRNSNSSTPASAFITLENLNPTSYNIWPDASGNLRIHTSTPTNADDTAGTVVGTQTSWIGLKRNVREWDGAEALEAIRNTPLYEYEFVNDAGNPGRVYRGLTIKDRTEWYAENTAENQTPVLDERTLFGYLFAAIQTLANRVEELEAAS